MSSILYILLRLFYQAIAIGRIEYGEVPEVMGISCRRWPVLSSVASALVAVGPKG
jgi:hypothetical protein